MIDLNLFPIKNKTQASVGKVLISEPLSDEDYFGRSLVLLTEHDDEKGSLGFVLNKKSNFVLSDLIEGTLANFPIYYGGPVQEDTLHFIHTLGNHLKGSIPLCDTIYWGGNIDDLLKLNKLGMVQPSNVKCFVGYSAWTPLQLKQEVDSDLWLISSLSEKEILSYNTTTQWQTVVRQLGDDYKTWLNIPNDPALN